jgi:hypothetical protein
MEEDCIGSQGPQQNVVLEEKKKEKRYRRRTKKERTRGRRSRRTRGKRRIIIRTRLIGQGEHRPACVSNT